jgi:hypothetical protein
MTTKAGVGYSEKTASKEAGIEAAKAAIEGLGGASCSLAIVYSTSKHDPAQLRDGIRSVIGAQARLIGGYGVGIITKDKLAYGGAEVGVAVFSSDTMTTDMFIEKGLPNNERAVGVKLGNQIKNTEFKGTPNIVLMYDSIKTQGTALNLATPLLEGMSESLQNFPPTAGIGLLGDMQFNLTHQWFDDRIEEQSAMALVLSGGVRMDTVIMHGCRPSGDYHVITKAEGAVVLEIDNKPALDVIAELLGPGSDKSWEDYPLFITLGVNKGDKFGEFKEEDYANRLCMAIDKERKALIMFEPDLKAGSEVQLMRRSLDFDYIAARAQKLYDELGSRKPFFALYIDCAGRASAYCATEKEEAAEVQRVIGSRMPLLGLYSGVEVAKVGPKLQALDWTGVLCVFSEA